MRKAIVTATKTCATVALSGLSLLHVLWAAGSAWPAQNRTVLADAIGGFSKVPRASACLAVATVLAASAASVAGITGSMSRVARFGSALTSLLFLLRGIAGLAGAMRIGRQSTMFVALNSHVYSPLCLAIGIASAAGIFADEPGS